MAANYGANVYEVELLTTQFTTKLDLLLQQKLSKLRGASDSGMHVGKQASPVQQIGVLEFKQPAGRYSPIVPQVPQYTRRWVFPNDRDLAVLVDQFDELRSIVDPKAGISEATAAAGNRYFDDLLTNAANGTASTGVDASSLSTESFSSTVSTSGGLASAGGKLLGDSPAADDRAEAKELSTAAKQDEWEIEDRKNAIRQSQSDQQQASNWIAQLVDKDATAATAVLSNMA